MRVCLNYLIVKVINMTVIIRILRTINKLVNLKEKEFNKKFDV